MKNLINLRRVLNAVAVISIAAIALFAGCTTSDDTLGYEYIPENQKMQVRFKSFYGGKVRKDNFDKEQNKFIPTTSDSADLTVLYTERKWSYTEKSSDFRHRTRFFI